MVRAGRVRQAKAYRSKVERSAETNASIQWRPGKYLKGVRFIIKKSNPVTDYHATGVRRQIEDAEKTNS